MSFNTCDHSDFLVIYSGRNCPVCENEKDYANQIDLLEDSVQEKVNEISELYSKYDFVMKMEDVINGRTIRDE